jgi:hypothetical protein
VIDIGSKSGRSGENESANKRARNDQTHAILLPGAFSAEVAAGSAQKMQQLKKTEQFANR